LKSLYCFGDYTTPEESDIQQLQSVLSSQLTKVDLLRIKKNISLTTVVIIKQNLQSCSLIFWALLVLGGHFKA
jgi:hypothetical protein